MNIDDISFGIQYRNTQIYKIFKKYVDNYNTEFQNFKDKYPKFNLFSYYFFSNIFKQEEKNKQLRVKSFVKRCKTSKTNNPTDIINENYSDYSLFNSWIQLFVGYRKIQDDYCPFFINIKSYKKDEYEINGFSTYCYESDGSIRTWLLNPEELCKFPDDGKIKINIIDKNLKLKDMEIE